MIFEHQDYRTFLKVTLEDRTTKSKGYSLRAFAKSIQVSNSFLSEVLSAKKSLSMDLAFKIAVRLALTEKETHYLCLLVQLEQAREPSFREAISKQLAAMNPKRLNHDLSVELFKVITEWYHLATLELTCLTNFKLSPASVADKLGISKVDADLAIDRLKRLELIEPTKNGYRKAKGYILSAVNVSNEDFKNYHSQHLEKAKVSLHSQSPQERMSATDVLAIDSKYVHEVDRLSQEFSAAVLRLGDKSKVKDSVYALSVHFYKLTNSGRKAE